jgi:hypothetical protein
MSAVSSTSSSAVTYATQLASAATLRNSLNAIGTAVQNGDMSTANSLLTTFIQNNPQYSSTSSSSTSTDPITQDFQTLATAVSGGDVNAARTAWSSVASDLSKDGVNLSNSAVTAQAIAQNKTTINQTILGDLFGSSPSTGSSPSVASLLGGGANSSGSVGLSSSLLSDWLTYDQNANTTPVATTTTPPTVLNTTA